MTAGDDEFRAGLEAVATPLPAPRERPVRPMEPELVPEAPDEIPGSLELFGEAGITVQEREPLVDFQSGEIIRTPEHAAMYLERLRELQRDRLRREIDAAEEYLLGVMDERGEYTLHLPGGVMATGDSVAAADRVEYDLLGLRAGLESTGVPEDRINEVIKTVVTEKVDLRELNRVAISSPERAAVIQAAESRTPRRRHVQVKPDKTGKRQ